jgi:heme-degrading monooxygenase HmoA
MSVLMTMRVTGDGAQAEKLAAEEPGAYAEVLEMAKRHGVISHRFYATADEILVLDRWPDEDAFHAFFGEAKSSIERIMSSVGMQGEPQLSFWRELSTGDEIG